MLARTLSLILILLVAGGLAAAGLMIRSKRKKLASFWPFKRRRAIRWKQVGVFALCLLGPLAIGFIGSLLTSPSIPGWYAALNKPMLAPPNWLFAPVWTLLFILMGIALYQIVISGGKRSDRREAFWIFGIQLFFNLLWSFLFFFLRQPGWAFLEIIILIGLIVLTIYHFAQIRRLAAWLLAPYLLWVLFASFLNYQLWYLN